MQAMAVNTPHTDIEILQRQRAKVTMMWVGIISIIMLFAGFTSGYILRMGQAGWEAIDLPPAFTTSTIFIVLSSLTMFWAQSTVKKGGAKGTLVLALAITLTLGIGFAISQYIGFQQLFAQGNSFVSNNSASSWMNLLPFMHLVHLSGGLISLMVVIFRASRGKYTAENHLGLRLSAIYWHFLDILWVYLFVFLYLIR